jgi:hypothetical protein
VSSAWRIVKNEFILDILIPSNTTATVYLPGESEGQSVTAGKYQFCKKKSPESSV